MTKSQDLSVEEALKIAADMQQTGRFEEAKFLYFRLLQLQPGNANIYGRIGTVFDAEGKLHDAINFYKKALSINPDFAAAHYNLANAYRDLCCFAESLPHYRRVLEINPHHVDAIACLHHALQHVCAWDEYDALERKLDAANNKAIDQQQRTPETPFVQITRCDNQSTNLLIANSWANYITANIPRDNYSFTDRQINPDKLRIGYLSRDFQDRPTGHLTAGMFAAHNRDNFTITAYSYGADDGSEYRKEIVSGCDNFIDITPLNYRQAAQKIYDDKIDILVDLQGYMAGNRLEIAAMHPAPVQVSYLGFPGTIGGGIFDYTITDKICVPENQAQFFSEKIAYLPNCYQVNNNKQIISDKNYKRADFFLPENGFVFGSFNWSHKLDRKIFTAWMEILREVPGSVLLLWKNNSLTCDNLRSFAQAHGVSGDRLIFAGKLPKADHLARLQLVDLALDTRIYGGHTTTSDSLWAMVPVITILGNHFASRVCASLLSNIGLAELITTNIEQYKILAKKIATDSQYLNSLKTKLSDNRLKEPLFDTMGFVRDLENLYQNIYKLAQ